MSPDDIILALAVNLAEVVADRQRLRHENDHLQQLLREQQGIEPMRDEKSPTP